MKISFEKYHGTGNDFILADGRKLKKVPGESQIRLLCDRHYGVGADGFMLLLPHPQYAFEMKYYNADGRESTLCGNGGRCMVAFATRLGLFGNKGEFLASDGPHTAEWLEERFVKLGLRDVARPVPRLVGYFTDTGSPHYVEFVDSVIRMDVNDIGRRIRNHAEFSPNGTNVNFVEIRGEARIFVRTYERGVEAETLSCGTGVTAAAISSVLYTGDKNNKYLIETLGGILEVEFIRKENGDFSHVYLTGPVIHVFSGKAEV